MDLVKEWCGRVAQSEQPISRPTSRSLIINHTRRGAFFATAVALGGSLGLHQVHVGQKGETWIGGGGEPSKLKGSEAVSRSRRGDGVSSGEGSSANSAPCAGLTDVQWGSRVVSVYACQVHPHYAGHPALFRVSANFSIVFFPLHGSPPAALYRGVALFKWHYIEGPHRIPPIFPSLW